MARRIRWQIVIAVVSIVLVTGLLGRLALTSASVATPLAGGTYVEAVIGAPEQPIPLLNDPIADPVGRSLGALLYDGLMRVGADGLLEPALAESYQVDASGEVYTFNLRRDVTWHDGEPFNADDVVFTLRTLQDSDAVGGQAVATVWQDVLVDRIDDYTIRCTLSAPFAPFLDAARTAILPAHLLGTLPPDQWGRSVYAQQLVGTGPYQLVELSDSQATLTANPTYFAGRPFIDRVEMRFIATPEAAVAALLRGDVQALGQQSSADLATAVPFGTLRRMAVPVDEYATLSFNLDVTPLDNQVFRQALARGLDKDTLIANTLEGRAVPLGSPILPGWWAYDPTEQWYAYNLDVARRTLTELGYDAPTEGGFRLRDDEPLALELITSDEPQRIAVAQEIARQWAEIGVRIDVAPLDDATFLQRLRDHDFQVALHGWARLGADPDVYALWHSSQADGGLNYAGLRDDTIDTLLENGRVQQELVARSEDYTAFQERWIELVPGITLYQPLYIFAADEQLAGVGFDQPNNNGSILLVGVEDRYRSINRWFLNSSREIQGDLR